MDDVRSAARAVAVSLITHVRQKGDNTKYGPIATKETEFKKLVEGGEYEDVRIGDLPSDQYGAIKEIGGTTFLVIDTENIPEKVLIENRGIFLEIHEKCGGFAIGDRAGIAKAMKMENRHIDTTLDRYEDRLPRRHHSVLEEALVLRVVERRRDLSRGTVYDWRGEIADQHKNRGHDPQEAQHLISLCSTGYFDKDNVFDMMYEEIVENGINTKEDYKRIIDKYIRDNPFAVFVRSDGTTAEEVCTLARDKSEKIGRYPWDPGFVDICGKGKGTHGIIDQVRDKLDVEFDAEITEYRDREIEKYVLRISPDTL